MYFLTLNSIYGPEIVVNVANIEYMESNKSSGEPCTTIVMAGSGRCINVKESLNQILQSLPPGFA